MVVFGSITSNPPFGEVQDASPAVPCWKCRWVEGTWTAESSCENGPHPATAVYRIKVKSVYREECRCKGLAESVESVMTQVPPGQWTMLSCGCSKGKPYSFQEPNGPSDKVYDGKEEYKFCVALPPKQELPCTEKPNSPYIGGWLVNCKDFDIVPMEDWTFEISSFCDSSTSQGPHGGADTNLYKKVAREIEAGAGIRVSQQGSARKAKTDCTKIFALN